jgi:hypothetical protein
MASELHPALVLGGSVFLKPVVSGVLGFSLLVFAIGCSRPAGPGPQVIASPTQPAPFTKANSANANPASANPGSATSSNDEAPQPEATPSAASNLVPDRIVIPAGTPITVRLRQTVSSANAYAGQRFEASLDAPLVVNGRVVADRGADAVGYVVDARHSGRLRHPGFLRLALESVAINGKMVRLHSSSMAAQGASHKKRNWGWIGGSTAGGALIGGLAGGGKGLLIGSLVGAGGGTTAAMLTGKHDVTFAAERRLTFRTAQAVPVS